MTDAQEHRRNLAELFNAIPPRDPSLVRELFCNRERELHEGMELLRAGRFDQICAVHGFTRCGKSHYVRRLLEDVRAQGLPFDIVTLNANNKGRARAVLADMFVQLRERLDAIADVPTEARALVTAAREKAALWEPLAVAETVEMQVEHADGSTTQSGLVLKAKPVIFEGAYVERDERRIGDTTRRTTRAMTDRDLSTRLRALLDAMSAARPGRTTLLFVDDLDLLDRRGREGQEECNRLVDLLMPLAEHPATLVLATVRHAYFNGRDKDLYDFMELGLMRALQITEIYARRIAVLNGGDAVFDEGAIRWLERSASGMVGIFLQRCHEVRRFAADRSFPLGEDAVRDFVRWKIENMRRDPAHVGLLMELEATVRAGRTELEIRQELSDTALLYSVVVPIAGRTGSYRINPVYFDELRAQAG